VTVRLPGPLPPDVIVIHDALGVAVHAQLLCTVTSMVRLPPDAATVSVSGSTVKLQVPPACVNANECPAIVSVADRGLVVAFATTL
jgi:hypothetical protein